MPQIQRYYKYIVAGLVIVVFVIVGIIISRHSQKAPVVIITPTSTVSTSGTIPVVQKKETGVSVPTTPYGKTSPSTSASPAQTTIRFITPVTGDLWKIGTYNPISWNVSAGVTGYIYLIDATTKNFVGVIIPSTGIQQNSYSWNTRDLLLSRSNPLKKNVVPGTYIIEMAFDANHLPIVASPAFTIMQ